jgi:hypothetical protein
MAETPETNKADFRNGFPMHDLRDGSMISGQADASGTKTCRLDRTGVQPIAQRLT